MADSYRVPEFEVGADGKIGLTVGHAFLEASREVNRGRASFNCLDELATSVGDWPNHPDLLTVKNWIIQKQAAPEELEVIFWLARSTRVNWANLPKRTASEHRRLYGRIQKLCEELNVAFKETGDIYYRGGGYGLMGASFFELLTESEASALNEILKDSNGIENLKHEWASPRLDELLERIGRAAGRLRKIGPIHTQPNKRGAERGYFVRSMGEIFQRRYGEVPAEVLAAITSVALGEPTERELVAKLLK